jgi:hypothetical protein
MVPRDRVNPPRLPPVGKRRCPACGVPMLVAQIQPSGPEHHDLRTFECSTCDYGETVTVKFRKPVPELGAA